MGRGKILFWKLIKVILFQLLFLNRRLSLKSNGFKSIDFAHESVIWTGFSEVSSFLSIQCQLGSFTRTGGFTPAMTHSDIWKGSHSLSALKRPSPWGGLDFLTAWRLGDFSGTISKEASRSCLKSHKVTQKSQSATKCHSPHPLQSHRSTYIHE